MSIIDQLEQLKVSNVSIQDFNSTSIESNQKDSLKNKSSTISTINRDYKKELSDKLIKRLIYRYTAKPKEKTYFSATEIIKCPKYLWYYYKGQITEDMISKDKLFYLLDVYAAIGTAVHNYIYKVLDFEFTEQHIIDEANHISGKFDIFDNGVLIDIKSSQNITDVSPQMSVYYYLLAKFQKKAVKKVFVWWVLKDTFQEIELSRLEQLYPVYVNRANNLYNALKLDKYPSDLGIDQTDCKYCPIEQWCKNDQSVDNISNSSDIQFLL